MKKSTGSANKPQRSKYKGKVEAAQDELEVLVQKHTRELSAANERLTLATSAAKMGIWDWDAQQNTLLWDQQMYKLYGIQPGEIGGTYEAWLQCVHPDDRQRSNEFVQRALRGEAGYDTEFCVLWPDGSIHWLKAIGQVFFDEAGRPLRMLGVSYDITERRQSGEQNIRLAERLNLATYSAHMGIWDWNIQKDELKWDEQMYALYGTRNFEGAYQAWLKGIHPEDRAFCDESIQLALSDEKDYDIEFRVIWDDGSLHWIKADGLVIRDEHQRPIRMVGVNYDITERKLNREKIERLAEQLDLAAESAQIGIWDWDVRNNVLSWDDRNYRVFGIKREDFNGVYEAWLSRVHPEDRSVSDERIQQALRGEKEFNIEFRTIDEGGSIHWIKGEGLVIRDENGRPTRMVGVNYDITHVKQSEQKLIETNRALEKALRAKDDFMAAMSHELRTPLTGIIGTVEFLELTAGNVLNEKQLNHFANIEASGRRLLDMVNNVLTYTQLQAGDLKPEERLCTLDQVCKVALQKISPFTEKKQQTTRYSVTPPDIKIMTDEIRLHKALSLLLDNASKFSAVNGEFGIHVTGREDAGLVDITVWDKGIGIAQENLPLLFKPFIQLDSSLTRQYDGAGLGLALVKSFTELLGGSVSVQSTLGQGSEFTLTLPWKK